MTYHLEYKFDIHINPFDCPDIVIYKSKNKYGIIIHDGGNSYLQIKFCPWCGSKLKKKRKENKMNLILETQRLLLRPLELSDAEGMFAMDNNPLVHKYLWQNPTKKIEETIKIIEYVQKQYAENNIGRFATILKETNEFIGWTGIKYINDHIENGNTNFYDYGYRLDEKFWNKGYATEASIAWLDYGFNKMNIDKINAYAHSENGASNHILQKVGMKFIEDYLDKDNVLWKWWQINNPNKQ